MHIKLQGTRLFTGNHFLPAHEVLILSHEGKVLDIVSAAEAGDNIQKIEGILCPGFVNTHCHLDLTHLHKKIERGTGLIPFLQEVLKYRNMPTEGFYDGMQREALQQYEAGTVAVGDICSTGYSLGAKKNSLIYWHNFIEISSFIPTAAPAKFAEAKLLRNRFQQLYTSGISKGNVSYTPHAPYSVSKPLFDLINEHSVQEVISMHNQETTCETDFFMTGEGDFNNLYKYLDIDISHYTASKKSSIASTLTHFNKSQKVVLVHNTCTEQADIDFIKLYAAEHFDRVSFCICINANKYIENAVPPLDILLENKCNIALGTDSLASNDSLSILSEMQTLQKEFPSLTASELLKFATINGATALGIENKYGSFETGKTPGVVVIKGLKDDGKISGEVETKLWKM